MTKDEYGNLLKYLGILRHTIYKLRDVQNDFEIKEELIQAINIIFEEMPILEEYINN